MAKCLLLKAMIAKALDNQAHFLVLRIAEAHQSILKEAAPLRMYADGVSLA
jgi:hypothetical protein